MAKDVYKESSIVEINGLLDKTEDEELIVFIEQKDAPPLEIDLIQILNENIGKQIACKLVLEKVI